MRLSIVKGQLYATHLGFSQATRDGVFMVMLLEMLERFPGQPDVDFFIITEDRARIRKSDFPLHPPPPPPSHHKKQQQQQQQQQRQQPKARTPVCARICAARRVLGRGSAGQLLGVARDARRAALDAQATQETHAREKMAMAAAAAAAVAATLGRNVR